MQFITTEYLSKEYIDFLQFLLKLNSNKEYDKIKEILGINNIQHIDNNQIINRYYLNKQMIFLTDPNPIITPRIFINDITKSLLDTILTITDNILTNRQTIDHIIEQYIVNAPKYYLDLESVKIFPNMGDKNIYVQINVSEFTWNKFKKMCNIGNMILKDAFELAVFTFLDDKIHR